MKKANADRARRHSKQADFPRQFEREVLDQSLAQGPDQTEIDCRVQAVIDLMAGDLRGTHSVGDLARQVHLSRFRLWHLFKDETGLTPMLYLKHLRLKRAAELLRSSFTPVNQILEEVGMDESRFYPAFKQMFGLTPIEFRQRHLPVQAKKSAKIAGIASK